MKIAQDFGVQKMSVFRPPRGNGCQEAKIGPREAHKGPIKPSLARENADVVYLWVNLGPGVNFRVPRLELPKKITKMGPVRKLFFSLGAGALRFQGGGPN